jgi:hypothetical protein
VKNERLSLRSVLLLGSALSACSGHAPPGTVPEVAGYSSRAGRTADLSGGDAPRADTVDAHRSSVLADPSAGSTPDTHLPSLLGNPVPGVGFREGGDPPGGSISVHVVGLPLPLGSGLEVAALARALTQHQPDFDACYAPVARTQPLLEGRCTVALSVTRDGHVRRATPTECDDAIRPLSPCANSVFRQIALRSHTHEDATVQVLIRVVAPPTPAASSS